MSNLTPQRNKEISEKILQTALKEVTSDEARKEIGCAVASITHMRAEIKKLDREEHVIRWAARHARRAGESGLYQALLDILKGLPVKDLTNNGK